MEPTVQPPVPIASAPLTGGGAPADAAAFQATYRETLDAPAPGRGVDIARDVRAVAQDFMTVERQLGLERVRMFEAFLPRATTGTGPFGDPTTRGALVARAGGGAMPVGGGGAEPAAFSGALARDSDRVALGTGPRALYSDAPTSAAPGAVTGLVQSSLGQPDGTDPNAIDFAGEIERLGNRHATMLEEINRLAGKHDASGSAEDLMRRHNEMMALVQSSSDVATQKNILANLYLGVYDETRTKAMMVVDLVQGAFTKLNQLFSQLKSGS